MTEKKNSTDFANAKKLIYVDKYEIERVDISINRGENGVQSSKAVIKFVKDGKETVLTSSEDDFVLLAWHLKSTIRDGKKKIVEIKDTNSYYGNMDFFISKSDDDVKNAIKELSEGKTTVNPSFSLQKALDDLEKKQFTSADVVELVERYNYVIAAQILKLKFVWTSFEKMKNKAYNPGKFMDIFNVSGRVYQICLFVLSPLEAVKVHNQLTKVDMEHIAKSLSHQAMTSNEKWSAMTDNGKKGLDGKIAAKGLVDDYKDYYEIAKKMLRHLAFIVSNSKNVQMIDSEENIEKVLKENGYGILVDAIDRRLRNCGVHWDVDYSEKGKIKFIESRSGKAKVVGEMSLEDLAKNTNEIKDLANALLLSIICLEELMAMMALDSPDLKFLLVENYRKA